MAYGYKVTAGVSRIPGHNAPFVKTEPFPDGRDFQTQHKEVADGLANLIIERGGAADVVQAEINTEAHRWGRCPEVYFIAGLSGPHSSGEHLPPTPVGKVEVYERAADGTMVQVQQPWELTRAEFVACDIAARIGPEWDAAREMIADCGGDKAKAHESAVAYARSTGATVPPEVLAEYPDPAALPPIQVKGFAGTPTAPATAPAPQGAPEGTPAPGTPETGGTGEEQAAPPVTSGTTSDAEGHGGHGGSGGD